MVVSELINWLTQFPPMMEVLASHEHPSGGGFFIWGMGIDTDAQPPIALIVVGDEPLEPKSIVGWEKTLDGLGWRAVYSDELTENTEGGSLPPGFREEGSGNPIHPDQTSIADIEGSRSNTPYTNGEAA